MNGLDEVRFRQTEMKDTVNSYIQFQKRYPTSRFASQAARKGENLAFREARAEGNEEAFRGFLNRFPGTSLISPMQTLTLKDQVALIIGEMGDVTAVPAMRAYVGRENTPAGRRALLKLEEKAGR